jgi:hypothetical protein
MESMLLPVRATVRTSSCGATFRKVVFGVARAMPDDGKAADSARS